MTHQKRNRLLERYLLERYYGQKLTEEQVNAEVANMRREARLFRKFRREKIKERKRKQSLLQQQNCPRPPKS